MANQQQDPKDFEKIEKYLRAAGLSASTIAQRMQQARNDSAAFALELKEADEHFANLNRDFNDLTAQFKNVLDDLKGWNSTSGLINKSFDKLSSIAEKLKNDAKGLSDLNKKELIDYQEKAKIELESLKTRKQELELKFKNLSPERISEISQQTTNKNLAKEASQLKELRGLMEDNGDLKNDENNYVKTLLALLDERIEKEKQVEKSVGLTGNALKALSKIPGLGSLKTEEAVSAMREEAKKLQEEGKSITSVSARLQIAGKGLATAFKGLKDTLLDPVSLMIKLVELGLKADKQVTELGKSFGVSKEAAGKIRTDIAEFANTTGDTFINTDRLLKAQSELSQELGIAVKFSNEELATFAKLTELTGLSAQEAGKLATNAAAAGMSIESYTDGIREGAFNAMVATKTHFSQKEIMQDISKLSAGILVKFQGNPKALAAAVVEAKKLGTDLATVDKIGQSLLNWESSIENELKAELMTGKQLNLERARAAALSGDQLTLTREIASQVGTLDEYSKMNVLAQQSLAEAFGLSRDEMSEMLMKQEAVNKYGAEAATLNKEQLEEMKRRNMSASEYIQYQEQQRAAQDKFADAMTKLQDLIGNLVAGPVGDLLDAFSNLVGLAMKLLTPIGYLIKPIAWIADKLLAIVSTPFGAILGGFATFLLFSNKISLALKSITAAKVADTTATTVNTGATVTNTGATTANTAATNTGILASIRSRAAKLANTIATGASTAATYAWNVAKGAMITLMNSSIVAWIREKAMIVANYVATGVSAAAQGAWNVVKGIGNLLMSTSIGMWIAEKVQIGLSTIAKWANIGATSAAATANATLATSQTAVGTTGTAAAGGLAAAGTALGAFGVAAAPAIPIILALGAALLMASPALYVLGKLFGTIAEVIGKVLMKALEMLPAIINAVVDGFVTIFNTLAANWQILIPVGIGLMSIAGGMTVLAVASLLAFPGLMLASVGLGAIAASASLLSIAGESINMLVEMLKQLGQIDATKLLLIGPALASIGVGLAAFGAGGLVGGILGGIGSLFGGGGPISTLTKISKLGPGIMQASTGLQGMAAALTQVSAALSALDTSKLKELSNFAVKMSIMSVVKGITDFITTPIKAVGETVGGGEKGKTANGGLDLTPLINAVNEVKASVDKLYAKDASVYLDGSKVGYISSTKSTQESYKPV